MIWRALWLISALGIGGALAHDGHRHAGHGAGAAKVALSDQALVDQHGARRRLAQDVIGKRIAIVNFVYTNCTTVCPVSSALFAQLQEKLGAALGKEVVLVSISVDPLRDTPERLREFSARYGARPGWTWLTGSKREVDAVLKGFGAYAPSYEDHPAMVLVGEAQGGAWFRFFGFPSPEQLLERVAALKSSSREAKARGYFTDTMLRTQDARPVRFYSDALRGKVVLVNFIFTRCGGACPLITATLVQAKKELGDAFGRDVRFVSISVDPEHDSPEELARFARKLDAVHPEWLFLTGDKAQLEQVVKRLGISTEDLESHSTAIIIGSPQQGRWRKLRPDASPRMIAAQLRDLAMH
jgi:cytochrome oxidase Cu insertion factor (SCO1/SenC/PrrC family)